MAPLAPMVRHFPGFCLRKNCLTGAVPFFSGVPPEGGGGYKKILRIFSSGPLLRYSDLHMYC